MTQLFKHKILEADPEKTRLATLFFRRASGLVLATGRPSDGDEARVQYGNAGIRVREARYGASGVQMQGWTLQGL